MRRCLEIAALSLALAFGLSIGNAYAIGSPDPVELLPEQEAETDALTDFEEKEVELQYRVLDPVEGDWLTIEEIIETVGAAGA